MRVVRYATFGNPADVVAVEELPAPTPGPGQALVRMRVRPINPSDLFAIRGMYGTLPRLPAVPGFEGAGVVVGHGPGAAGPPLGQLVVPLGAGGTWQEYVVVPAAQAIPVPEGIGDRQAAMALVNPSTAWLLLSEVLRPAQGEWVLQNGANSAVGRHVIQIARRRGVGTISVVRRRDVVAELRALGADEIICEADEDVAARVREVTQGRGAHYALDAVGGASGERLLQSLAPGGTLLVYGAMGGAPLTIDPGQLLFRGLTVRGWWLTHWFRHAKPAQIAGLFESVFGLIADGTLDTPVAAEYDLAEVRAAIAAAEAPGRSGKILLVG